MPQITSRTVEREVVIKQPRVEVTMVLSLREAAIIGNFLARTCGGKETEQKLYEEIDTILTKHGVHCHRHLDFGEGCHGNINMTDKQHTEFNKLKDR